MQEVIVDSKARWYENSPKGLVESSNIKILWDCAIQYDKKTEAQGPDIAMVDKVQKKQDD